MSDDIRTELIEMEDLSKKNVELATMAIKDSNLLSKILEGLDDKDFRVRWGSLRVVREIASRKPELLRDHVSKIVGLLKDRNTLIKNHASIVILKLSKIDPKSILEYADEYLKLLDERDAHYRVDAVNFLGNIKNAEANLFEKYKEKLEEMFKKDENPLVVNAIKHVLKSQ